MAGGTWADKFNVLVSKELQIEDNKVWKFAIEESKTKGTLQMNVREFKSSETYEGPTKNGFIKGITSKEDIEKIQNSFNEFFEEIKKML